MITKRRYALGQRHVHDFILNLTTCCQTVPATLVKDNKILCYNFMLPLPQELNTLIQNKHREMFTRRCLEFEANMPRAPSTSPMWGGGVATMKVLKIPNNKEYAMVFEHHNNGDQFWKMDLNHGSFWLPEFSRESLYYHST